MRLVIIMCSVCFPVCSRSRTESTGVVDETGDFVLAWHGHGEYGVRSMCIASMSMYSVVTRICTRQNSYSTCIRHAPYRVNQKLWAYKGSKRSIRSRGELSGSVEPEMEGSCSRCSSALLRGVLVLGGKDVCTSNSVSYVCLCMYSVRAPSVLHTPYTHTFCIVAHGMG